MPQVRRNSSTKQKGKRPTSKLSNIPPLRSTYRLQIHKDFPLNEAARVAAYLDELGISHLYLSPVLESRPGSNHGYDGIDPTRISEERGGEAAFDQLISKVEKAKSLEGVILDIVPNHVAASWQNPTWWDVLKCGQMSKYWRSYDIRPRAPGDMRVVLPVLGRSRQAILAARELQLGVMGNAFVLKYWDSRYPIAYRSYPRILKALFAELERNSSADGALHKQMAMLVESDDETGEHTAKSFAKWIAFRPQIADTLNEVFKAFPLKVLEATLNEQHYALEEWRSGSRQINYRRFFDINDLAAVRVEDDFTFNWTHSKIRELVKKYPVIHGLRVDHVDGLTDPESYLRKLRGISKQIWVEKILGDGEHIPSQWPVTGTTGYEFSGCSARLFVDLPGLLHLHSHYTRHVDRRWERFHECVYDSKREMLDSHFISEITYLVDQFYALAQKGKSASPFTKDDLMEALKELTSSLKVYRTYFSSGELVEDRYLKEAFAEVEGRGRLTSKESLSWLRSILLGSSTWSESTYITIKRWEQLTGPVMAKGLEDTALYRYFPLLSLNVVGGEPDWTGDGAIEFHAANSNRMRTQPLTMNTTSTHDTKRSEDVRSRIHVVSEISEEWTALFEEWHKINTNARMVKNRAIPERPVEYLMYETLAGAWPLDGKITPSFLERMKQYFLKAVREAKSETSWTEPDSAYEEALMVFLDHILSGEGKNGRAFMSSFQKFAQKCSYFGAFNSLSLLTLKAFSPGLPDFYQGCEMWDLSLVDPDNRRPVDYDLRRKLLKEMKQGLKENRRGYMNKILSRWKTGEIKLWLTWEFLQLRKANPDLFIKGEYFSIEPKGEGRRHFVAFMRKFENRWALVVTTRFLASQESHEIPKKLEIRDEMVLATEFHVPPQAPTKWTNALTREKIDLSTATADEILGGLPVAVLFA